LFLKILWVLGFHTYPRLNGITVLRGLIFYIFSIVAFLIRSMPHLFPIFQSFSVIPLIKYFKFHSFQVLPVGSWKVVLVGGVGRVLSKVGNPRWGGCPAVGVPDSLPEYGFRFLPILLA
jgi:hypothetical protein